VTQRRIVGIKKGKGKEERTGRGRRERGRS